MASPRKHSQKQDRRAAIVFCTVVAVLLLALVLLLGWLFFLRPAGEDAQTAPSPSPTVAAAVRAVDTPVPEPTATPFSPRTVTIRAVGDVMMHEAQLDAAARPGEGYDFSAQYADIAPSLMAADYVIANLETTVGLYSDHPYSGFPRFNAPPELLTALQEAGVDFVTMANNHILDRFYDGMLRTMDNVEAAGLAYGGTNRSKEEQLEPNIVEVNGVSLGMLCYTDYTNGLEKRSDPKARESGVNYIEDADFAAEAQKLREAGADAIIAYMHWGREYRREANDEQRAITERLLAAGVDVILGSHPHVVQPAGMREVTLADGTKHEALVAYSLGNFNSAMTDEYTDSGIILEFTLVEQEEGGFAVENIGFVPTYCWEKDGVFTTIPALSHYDEAPEGMSDAQHQRLRKSVDDVTALMGGRLNVLEM